MPSFGTNTTGISGLVTCRNTRSTISYCSRPIIEVAISINRASDVRIRIITVCYIWISRRYSIRNIYV